MAPTPHDRDSPQPSPNDDDNAFIAFRRFTDEAFASMLQGLVGLPSAFETHSDHERWLPYDEQARRRTMQSWGASPQEQATWNRETARDVEYLEPRASPNVADAQDDPVGDAHLRCPYRPPGTSRQRSAGEYENQPEGRAVLGSPLGLWLARYLASSPYSPSNLEQRADMGDVPWRDAFEDLVEAQKGNGLRPEGRRDPRLAPSDWAHSVVQRMVPATPSRPVQSLAARAPEGDQEEDMTELDMYERFLGSELRESKEQSVAPAHKEKPESSLGIVSTLTTTERVSLPDGTTHTKMILKKRFADGREESSETVHTTKGRTEQEEVRTTDKTPRGEFAEAKESKVGAKQGWFWS